MTDPETKPFSAFIAYGKNLARVRNVDWDFEIDDRGLAVVGWDLTAITGASPPPRHLVRDFGLDDGVLALMNKKREEEGLSPREKSRLPAPWIDLLKAYVCDLVFAKEVRNGSVSQFFRALRVLATVGLGKAPWSISLDDFRTAMSLAKECQPSGTMATCIRGIALSLFDANHLATGGPFRTLLEAPAKGTHRRAAFSKSVDEMRGGLQERKTAEKLPERRALWELVRILFTEQPRSFSDVIRFAQAKTLLICGLRGTEAALIPLDWKRTREYFDTTGRPAGELGGRSTALLLRHFAEKQGTKRGDAVLLTENGQFVPEMFQEILSQTLEEVARLTEPLRSTLRLQRETGRLFPTFQRDELVLAARMPPYLTGNPVVQDLPRSVTDELFAKYRRTFDASVFDTLAEMQTQRPGTTLSIAQYVFFTRLRDVGIPIRASDGSILAGRGDRVLWGKAYFRIDELEDFYRGERVTKLPDLIDFRVEGGRVLRTSELLFLAPKRPLSEERGGGLCDVTRYFAVGRSDGVWLENWLGSGPDATTPTVFEEYGQTDEDRQLRLKPHSLRHLQNAELFRLEVADTIITKRFNRKSVAQSYEYDHRSLGESLERVTIPDEWAEFLGEGKAATVAKMIEGGYANGPIVREFKRIRAEEGDEAAYTFLKVEADGFHATPYGHCLNSFTVDPCPKHLECFNGCRNLSATNLPENRSNLERLEGKFYDAQQLAIAKSTNSLGRDNQIQHATVRLDAVRKLLATPSGQRPFPDGPDLSLPAFPRTPLDGPN